MKISFGLLFAVMALTVAPADPAPFPTLVCDDSDGSDLLSGSTFQASVIVPAGATCTLGNGIGIAGDVTVEPEGFLVRDGLIGSGASAIGGELRLKTGALLAPVAKPETTVGGDLIASEPAFVRILGFAVGGELRVMEACCAGLAGEVDINSSSIAGDIRIAGGATNIDLELAYNTIGGSVQVNDNTARSGIAIGGNVIAGDLACSGNSPSPSLHGLPPNSVAGAKKGQCASL